MVKIFIFLLVGAVLAFGFENCGNQTKFYAAPSSSLVTNTTLSALACSAGSTMTSIQTYPTNCLVPPGLPASVVGLEMNNNFSLAPRNQNSAGSTSNTLTLNADDQTNGTPADRTLYIEIATYVAPDTIVITAQSVAGQSLQILNICDAGTWNKGDITKGLTRPYSDEILEFSVVLPKGTKSLAFDFTNALSPTYTGVWNLGDFQAALNNPATNPFPAAQAQQFRVMTALPTPLNDNADPAYPTLCH